MKKEDKEVISKAKKILDGLLKTEDLLAINPQTVMDYCQLTIAHLEHEVFGVLYLNNRHKLIKKQILFKGTINQCAVYPREVAKKALQNNAASIILFHNHPSGSLIPSEADKAITNKISDALSLFDIKTIDHIIVTNKSTISLAELGLI